jgi:DNA-binding transcriptional LysR family regulator
VAEALSFRQAAGRLGVQISSLSRAVAILENELGVSLFTRSTQGARLTDVGRSFLIDARRILTDVDRARDAAQ